MLLTGFAYCILYTAVANHNTKNSLSLAAMCLKGACLNKFPLYSVYKGINALVITITQHITPHFRIAWKIPLKGFRFLKM